MQGISLNYILPKFINNTIYKSDPILRIIQIAMASALVDINKIPLTVISSFQNVPDKLGYYYTPTQLQYDSDNNMFPLSMKEFERARYGAVRLKLNYMITGRQFLTTAIHEYTHAVQYEEKPEVLGIIGENPMVVEAKEQAAYELSGKLTETVCCEAWVVEMVTGLDKELSWI